MKIRISDNVYLKVDLIVTQGFIHEIGFHKHECSFTRLINLLFTQKKKKKSLIKLLFDCFLASSPLQFYKLRQSCKAC